MFGNCAAVFALFEMLDESNAWSFKPQRNVISQRGQKNFWVIRTTDVKEGKFKSSKVV